MSSKTLNILFIADIVGENGITFAKRIIKKLKQKHSVDFCIANGENLSDGRGMTIKAAQTLFDMGINVITSGNHFWDKYGHVNELCGNANILRPDNYPEENPGTGANIYYLDNKYKVAVINLQGRTFMYPIDCPFKKALERVEKIKDSTKIIIVDFHAEATAEKQALGHFLAGKVSAVIGTHTHVQTADEKILEGFTAYITDAGMTGPVDSVIGLRKDISIKRFIYQTPMRYSIANGVSQFNGVVLKIDKKTGKSVKIKRISLLEDESNI